MYFISTRDENYKVSGAEAVTLGLSRDGGLFAPEALPAVTAGDIRGLGEAEYRERAARIINKFLPDFACAELSAACEAAYGRFKGEPAPVVKVDGGLYFLELWHGPTHAFKDMALTLLPRLMLLSKKETRDKAETLILTATSGDTGKAALEGFRDVEGVKIAVFYPSAGVSETQRLQMTTQEGGNVAVYGIRGNFDDAQNAVKAFFADASAVKRLAEKGFTPSSANSINFGRLAAQIVYYFSAYADLLGGGEIKEGEKINFCVPTGNFGNILSAYYAKRAGLPINKLICASNANDVLCDFFNTGVYDINRRFIKTTSPSMDILISSNLERLLFEICDGDGRRVAALAASLKASGRYEIINEQRLKLAENFYAGYADENETRAAIKEFFAEYGYVADPHTAVAAAVYGKYAGETGDETKTVIVGTASPYKFAADVLSALGGKEKDPWKAFAALEKLTAMPAPDDLAALRSARVRFNEVVDKGQIADKVFGFVDCK